MNKELHTDKNPTAEEFLKGLWRENPVFVAVLGMCPALAVTNSGINGLAMGLATTFVLVCSSTLVSLFRNVIPKQVRITSFIVIIATFVTIVDRLLAAYMYQMSKTLGPYIPLIIVNCIIICRAEACASKNGLVVSIIDAVGMGIGFTITLCILAAIRELLATGAIFEIKILSLLQDGGWFVPWAAMSMPVGAFITLGLMLGLVNKISNK